MISFVYQSQASMAFDIDALNALTEYAAAKNHANEITGYMWFHENTFIQYIEGTSQKVTALVASLKRDTRHKILVECFKDNIQERLFPGWTMKLFTNSNEPNMSFEYLINGNLTKLSKAQEKQPIENLLWRQVTSLAKFQKQIDKLNV